MIENITLPVLYEAPMMLEQNGLADIVCEELHMECPRPDLTGWEQMIERIHHASEPVEIALVGKYVQLHDAYLSVAEALHTPDMKTARTSASGGWIRRKSVKATSQKRFAAAMES